MANRLPCSNDQVSNPINYVIGTSNIVWHKGGVDKALASPPPLPTDKEELHFEVNNIALFNYRGINLYQTS